MMFKSGDCVRCLDATGYPLTTGANYLVEVGQVDGGSMISLVGYEGAFLASRFELVDSSSNMAEVEENREQLIKKCVDACLPRIAAAAGNAIRKLHLIIDGAAKFTTATEVAERQEHMSERVAGVHWATEWTVDLLGVDVVCERMASGTPFDVEQLTHDAKVKLRQIVREL